MKTLRTLINYPPVFVIGVGRSGTTLVQSMLNAHPEICFPPETAFFRRYIANGRSDRLFRKRGKVHLLSILSSDEGLKRLRVDFERAFENLESATDAFSAANFYLLLLKDYAKGRSTPRICDKDPRLIEYLPALYHYFPDAYVVHVIRDPRDTIVSRSRAAWCSQRSFYHHLFAYNAQLRIGKSYGVNLFKKRYSVVLYEQLIKFPEETLRDLCKNLDLRFDPAMLNFSGMAKEIVANDEMPWKQEVLGPLLSRNFGKWKGLLSEFQIALVDSTLRDLMTKFNYPLANKRILGSDLIAKALVLSGSIYSWYRFLRQAYDNYPLRFR
jgi:hypothetical protein